MINDDNRMFELKVGIFVAIAVIIFFIIIFSIGDVYLVRKGYYLKVVFNFANGIAESSPVRVAGVNVGRVDKIKLFFDEKEKRTKVRLFVWIGDDHIKIVKNSTPVINTLGLLGEKYLEILPAVETEGFLKAGDEVTGRDPIPTEFITEKFGELADSTNVVMTRLKEGKGTVGKLLVEEKIYNDLEAFVQDIKNNPWKLLNKPRSSDR